eukprot:TRINITY_DN2794_c0_g1_i4.p1 TRINITY_DN2794_c0_g1~~TRINITY_DN2794_c0_g1_i4.p1  ORF type:complete len:509 (+),score=39.67 TRINITY_DN2794_c0_g1_i4:115-1641(+)
MIRRPPRSTLSSSSAASDVYKRQVERSTPKRPRVREYELSVGNELHADVTITELLGAFVGPANEIIQVSAEPVRMKEVGGFYSAAEALHVATSGQPTAALHVVGMQGTGDIRAWHAQHLGTGNQWDAVSNGEVFEVQLGFVSTEDPEAKFYLIPYLQQDQSASPQFLVYCISELHLIDCHAHLCGRTVAVIFDLDLTLIETWTEKRLHEHYESCKKEAEKPNQDKERRQKSQAHAASARRRCEQLSAAKKQGEPVCEKSQNGEVLWHIFPGKPRSTGPRTIQHWYILHFRPGLECFLKEISKSKFWCAIGSMGAPDYLEDIMECIEAKCQFDFQVKHSYVPARLPTGQPWREASEEDRRQWTREHPKQIQKVTSLPPEMVVIVDDEAGAMNKLKQKGYSTKVRKTWQPDQMQNVVPIAPFYHEDGYGRNQEQPLRVNLRQLQNIRQIYLRDLDLMCQDFRAGGWFQVPVRGSGLPVTLETPQVRNCVTEVTSMGAATLAISPPPSPTH